jgi:UDPglucose 6-dehydrogenase
VATGHADLTYVYEAAREIAAALTGDTVIVTKSTVPVGTGDRVEEIIREIRPELRVEVVSNPEFLREGAAIGDFKRPDRIVVGSESEWARDVMREIYRPLYLNQAPMVFTSRRSSELIKYAANAFLAVKITFINEIADLCEAVGAEVQDVSRGIGLDNRIGAKFLHAGPGYGGSCFPKDTVALLKTAEDHATPLRIVEATVQVNDSRKRAMGRRILQAMGPDVRGRTVGLLGLTFKPNTDDMRDAPSLAIIRSLQDAGVHIKAYDPEGMEVARELIGDVELVADPYEVARDADALAIVTEWDVFRALDLSRIASSMRAPVLVDLRNIYSPGEAERAGLRYLGVGSPQVGQGVSD